MTEGGPEEARASLSQQLPPIKRPTRRTAECVKVDLSDARRILQRDTILFRSDMGQKSICEHR